jgi:DNA ligase D-like protein (predicted 3'-phosphoesterase)
VATDHTRSVLQPVLQPVLHRGQHRVGHLSQRAQGLVAVVARSQVTDPREKRLAVEVEDHRLDYGDFEGVVEGRYGAGAVIVWDQGTYRSLDAEDSMAEAIAAGHVKVWLEGKKPNGGWTLQRTRAGEKPQWLLIKRRDAQADARRNPQSTQPESVRSGRTSARS